MLCVVISGPHLTEASEQILQNIPYANLFEFRLDLFSQETLDQLDALRKLTSIPVLYTCRSQAQGGFNRLAIIEKALETHPDYLDIEITDSQDWISDIRKRFPYLKWIASSHHYDVGFEVVSQTHQCLEQISADIYKIAILPHSEIDTLKLLNFTKHSKIPLSTISMGEKGSISRILSPIYGGALSFAADLAVAPGQISAQTLVETYHFDTLNRETKVYALIGDPTNKSISHLTHNQFFRSQKENAVYVKLDIAPQNLKEALSLIRELGWKGLSVTMPHKETIVPLLDECEPAVTQIGAANTIHFHEGKLIGYNTDGKGAMQAILQKTEVANKTIVIIGAGGSARAIGYEIIQQGGRVIFLNRHPEKAEKLARQFGGEWGGLEHLLEYDILINCTPSPLPISEAQIRPYTVVMDINSNPKETPLIQAALKKECQVIYGIEMFVAQAALQFEIWGFTLVGSPLRH